MKKLLLTTALVGVAFVATPAMAEVQLGLGGHMKGYVTYNDQDEAAGSEARSVDILRETEIHFTGETTLDNGLTVGFHAEAETDGNDGFDVEESYAYFAGNWGRVNFGAEDGAAYLLQVAAPSADSNVDGIRQYINPVNYAVAPAAYTGFTANFDYDQAQTGYSDKLTYITPVFNGFQAAASYTPEVYAVAGTVTTGGANNLGVNADDTEDDLGSSFEVAARYEGQFNAVRLTLGAGYTTIDIERDLVGNTHDDNTGWNVGAGLGFGAFNVGAAYVADDNVGGTNNVEDETWVVGVDYTNGPWVLGASYFDQERDVPAGGVDVENNRYSGGVTYTYGPGMTFRGSVHHMENEVSTAGVSEFDATSILLGTQINF